jgi:PhnB protein
MTVQPIPPGYHTITPYLIAADPTASLDFLERGLGGEVTERMEDDSGVVRHAEVRIGDSLVMLGPARPDWPARPAMLYLYVEDCEAWYARALEQGATSVQAPTDQFYGDRVAAVQDAAGNQWWLATHVEDVTPDEMQKRMQAMHG